MATATPPSQQQQPLSQPQTSSGAPPPTMPPTAAGSGVYPTPYAYLFSAAPMGFGGSSYGGGMGDSPAAVNPTPMPTDGTLYGGYVPMYAFMYATSTPVSLSGLSSAVRTPPASSPYVQDVYAPYYGSARGFTDYSPSSYMLDVFSDPFWGPSGGIGGGARTRRTAAATAIAAEDVFYPLFAPRRRSGGVVNPFAGKDWDVKEDEEGLYLTVAMPGLDKQHLKLSVENNKVLVIKGQVDMQQGTADQLDGGVDTGVRYASRLHLPKNVFKMEEIKAEMKNGVLKLMIPKLEEDERNDVFHVIID